MSPGPGGARPSAARPSGERPTADGAPVDHAPADRSPVERAGHGAFDHALHGGTGRTRVQYHFADRMTMPVAVQTWTLDPGASEGPHAHPDPALEEFYLVLSGMARLTVDGEEYVLSEGDAILCPPEAEHDLRNPGAGPLRVLVVWGPPGAADFTGYATYRKAVTSRGDNGGGQPPHDGQAPVQADPEPSR